MSSLAGFGRLHVHLGAFANLVGAASHNRVAIFQRSKYFDEVADSRASTDIHPLSHAVGHPNHEGPFRGRDDTGWRHEQRWLWSPHGPLDFRVHACAESQVRIRSEEHTSELQSQSNLVCRLLLEKKKNT